MPGSGWRHSNNSCCKTPLGDRTVGTAWQISRGRATSSTTGGVWTVLCHISRSEEVMRECDIHHIRVLSRLKTALLTWAASLGWTSAVTCCNIYREYYVPTCTFWVFTSSYTRIDFARTIITQIVFHMKCKQIQFSYYIDDIFCSIFFVLFNM